MGFTGTKNFKNSQDKHIPMDDAPSDDEELKGVSNSQSNNFAVSGSTKTDKIHKEESTNNEEDALLPDFLKPKKDVNQSALNDLFKVESNKKTAFQITLKTLNALNIVSPIMKALMNKPGVDGTNEQLSAGFKSLIQETSSLSEKICKKLNVDPENENNYWIRNVLEKHFSDLIEEQWSRGKTLDFNKMEVFFDGILQNIDHYKEKAQYEEYSEMTQIKVGVLKASSKILNTIQSTFDLHRDVEKDIKEITEKLFNLSAATVDKLADEYASPKDRAKLFYSTIIQAADTYSVAWEMEVKRVNQIMDNTPKEKLEKLMARYKENGGLPIDKIEHDFNKYFNKTIAVTEKLIFSQKGTLEKRLKNR